MSYPPPPPPPGEQPPGGSSPYGSPGGAPGYDPPGYNAPANPPPGYGGPGYGGPAYGGPGYGGGYGGVPQSNNKALWSMIIGIVSIPLICCSCFAWIGIAAIVLGNQAKREIAASGGMQTGEGQAKAGVILGWVGVVLGTVVLALNIVLYATGNTGTFNFQTGT